MNTLGKSSTTHWALLTVGIGQRLPENEPFQYRKPESNPSGIENLREQPGRIIYPALDETSSQSSRVALEEFKIARFMTKFQFAPGM